MKTLRTDPGGTGHRPVAAGDPPGALGVIRRTRPNGRGYWTKTGRIYGAVNKLILNFAADGRTFSREDLPLTPNQARDRLWQLARAGILRVVRRGINGPHGQPPLYQLNTKTL